MIRRERIETLLGDYGAPLALLVALAATLGSLYYSEVAGFVPCTLCWYQRILMYPLVLIALVGMLRQDSNLPFYMLPLALIGLGFSAYHVMVQGGLFSQPGTCAMGVPCSSRYVDYFEFITIPIMALTAFGLITSVSLALVALPDQDAWDDDTLETEPAPGQLSTVQRGGWIGSGVVLAATLLLIIWFAAAGNSASSEIDKLETGEELFAALVLDGTVGCAVCHSVEPGITMVGPSMSGLSEAAASRVPGLSAEAYLRQSILEPDAYLVEGYGPGIMYAEYGELFSDEQLDLLVDYLLTLP